MLWLAGLGLWLGGVLVQIATSSVSPAGVLVHLAGSIGMALGAIELAFVFLRSPTARVHSYVSVLVLLGALLTTIHYFGLGLSAMGSAIGQFCTLPWMVEGIAFSAVTIGYHYLAATLIRRVPHRRGTLLLYCAAVTSMTASATLLIARVSGSIGSDYFKVILIIFAILVPYVTSLAAVGAGLMALQAVIAQQRKWTADNETLLPFT